MLLVGWLVGWLITHCGEMAALVNAYAHLSTFLDPPLPHGSDAHGTIIIYTP